MRRHFLKYILGLILISSITACGDLFSRGNTDSLMCLDSILINTWNFDNGDVLTFTADCKYEYSKLNSNYVQKGYYADYGENKFTHSLSDITKDWGYFKTNVIEYRIIEGKLVLLNNYCTLKYSNINKKEDL